MTMANGRETALCRPPTAADLQPILAVLREDLLARAQDSGVRAGLEAAHRREREAGRTADAFEVWCRGRTTQVAAAWVLSCLFVRTLEDRGLLARRRLAGPGAEDSQAQLVELAPFLGARDYLMTVFRELSRLPGAGGLFDARHNPVWVLAPSSQAAAKLLALLREPDEQGGLRFQLGGRDTAFLGDLYQDLDEEVRSRYALLQTPEFVQRFILDGTLEPALRQYGLEKVKVIDPTCGSGHFLLGAFARLHRAWVAAEPATDRWALAQRALDQVYGADLNPYAVAIARFRLTLAFLEATGTRRLEEAPAVRVNVCVADSLLHGVREEQTRLSSRASGEGRKVWGDELFALEDEAEALRILGGRYQVVVGNPPYITEKDRARREVYRGLYKESASGKFALAAPFTERFFGLAATGGFVGMINANSFMKREFGKALIEKALPRVELTGVVDTSGAYIPGHGTPTVILFGRNQRHGDGAVLAVMGKRGEPSTPEDPANGLVWSSIRDHHREVGFENEYVSVAEVERERFAKHPWSLGGGGAAELKALLEERAEKRLGEVAVSVGISSVTGEDDLYLLPPRAAARLRVGDTRPMVIGEDIRDWSCTPQLDCVFPYDKDLRLRRTDEATSELRYLECCRAVISRRKRFGVPMLERGLTWYELQELYADKLRTPLSIAFAFVATHNHFVLDRGGKVFKQSAPIIKLPEGATEEDHLAILGYLNSSTACFWMKQTFFDKGNRGEGGGTTAEAWERFYEHDGTKVATFPLPEWPLRSSSATRLFSLAKQLTALGERWRATLPTPTTIEGIAGPGLGQRITELSKSRDRIERQVRWLQEELDWTAYRVWGLTHDLSAAADQDAEDGLGRGERASDILFAWAIVNGDVGQRFFTLCGLPPPSEIAEREPNTITQRRIDLIRGNRELELIEQPRYKRTYRESFAQQPALREALAGFVLDAAEKVLSARADRPAVTTVRELAHELSRDPKVNAVAEVLTGESAPDLQVLLGELVKGDAVPYLAAHRYKDTGLEKRALWERTWELQRREDAGETLEVPVPPRYDSKDFRDQVYWRHRGKLDVPKERFIAYPSAEGESDRSAHLGWAGWDHLQQAAALAALYRRRRHEEGWDRERDLDRLKPILAGLLELLPWLKQWHNEPDTTRGGIRLGDTYEAFLNESARELGVTLEDLHAWRPQAAKGRKRKKAKEPVE
jgi:hypothetical protein